MSERQVVALALQVFEQLTGVVVSVLARRSEQTGDDRLHGRRNIPIAFPERRDAGPVLAHPVEYLQRAAVRVQHEAARDSNLKSARQITRREEAVATMLVDTAPQPSLGKGTVRLLLC